MPARDQTLLVLDSEIDHKQLFYAVAWIRSSFIILIKDEIFTISSSFQQVGKKNTRITTFSATFSQFLLVLAKKEFFEKFADRIKHQSQY